MSPNIPTNVNRSIALFVLISKILFINAVNTGQLIKTNLKFEFKICLKPSV